MARAMARAKAGDRLGVGYEVNGGLVVLLVGGLRGRPPRPTGLAAAGKKNML